MPVRNSKAPPSDMAAPFTFSFRELRLSIVPLR